MIEFLSTWAKGLGVTIVIVSILEMLLPNNKTKKYIKMVMGIYILFNIINPFVHNKDIFNMEDFNLEDYGTSQAKSTINQESMDKRIEELYIEELEKDISKKIEKKGFKVNMCKVNAKISNKEDETKITKIKLNIQRNEEEQKKGQSEDEGQSLENKIVVGVQKVKPIDTNIKNKERAGEEGNITKNESEGNLAGTKKNKSLKPSRVEIQNIKKFLIEEYGVSEKCLEIN